MERNPFLHHSEGFGRKIAFKHISGHKVDGCNILVVDCVNVRRIMLVLKKVHSNDDPIESCQYGHEISPFLSM